MTIAAFIGCNSDTENIKLNQGVNFKEINIVISFYSIIKLITLVFKMVYLYSYMILKEHCTHFLHFFDCFTI